MLRSFQDCLNWGLSGSRLQAQHRLLACAAQLCSLSPAVRQR